MRSYLCYVSLSLRLKSLILGSVSLFCLLSINVMATGDETKFILSSLEQTLKFKLKDEKIITTLEVKEVVRSQDNTGQFYKKYMYYDDKSSIENIIINHNYTSPIISTDLPRGGIFHNDTKMAYVEKACGVKGKDITIEYEKIFSDYRLIDILRFQNTSYAIDQSTINIEVPDWLDFDIKKMNFTNDVEIYEPTQKSKVFTFKMKDLKAIPEEGGVPDFRKYQAHILLIFNNMKVKNRKVKLMPKTDDLYEWYASIVNTIDNNSSDLKPIVEKLIKDKETDIDKIKAIYYFVQDNIKYIAFEHGIMGFKPESCQKVYANRFGDCKGMANLIKEMLKLAGFDARLTWLGTSDIPYDYSLPSVYVDNHMICTVKLGEEYIFLDATQKFCDLNSYGDFIQGRQVMIEDGEKYILNYIPKQNTDSFIKKSNALVIEGDQLKGIGDFYVDGINRTIFQNIISSADKKDVNEQIESFITNSDYNLKCKLAGDPPNIEREKDLIIKYNLIAENQVIKVGNEYYINLDFDQPYAGYKFKEERISDFEFSSKLFYDYATEFTLPANSKVKYIPTALEEDNEFGSFSLSYEQNGNSIKYKRKISLKKNIIKKEEFQKWNDVIKRLNSAYDDRLVLEYK